MPVWSRILIISLGGALGALARTGTGALVGRWVQQAHWGTLAVNLLGCLLMGAGRAAIEDYGWGSPQVRALVFSGFLGAFTTFSTFEADGAALWRGGAPWGSMLYLGGSVVGGAACFWCGWWIIARGAS